MVNTYMVATARLQLANCLNMHQIARKTHHSKTENEAIFWRGGTAPPRPLPHWGGDTPNSTPLGAYGASTLAPSALDLPLPVQ